MDDIKDIDIEIGDIPIEEAIQKIKDLYNTSRDSLRQYSVPVKAFLKLVKKYENCIWRHKEVFEDQVVDWEIVKEKDKKKNDGLVSDWIIEMDKGIAEMKEGMELIILQDTEGELYGVYFKGIPLEKIKTIGGMTFSEVAAKHVGIYNPQRNSPNGHCQKSAIVEI